MISTKRKRSGLWTFALLMVLVTGVAAGGLHQLNQSNKAPVAQQTPPEKPAAADTTSRPEREIALEGEHITLREVQRSVGAVGSFSGYDEVTVTAEVTGRVAKVFHDVGDVVNPGEALVELDKTDFQLALDETCRAMELEVIRLGVEIPQQLPSPEQVVSLSYSLPVAGLPPVIRAKKLEEIALLRKNRAEELMLGKAMSEEDVQQRRTEYDVAKAAWDQATNDALGALAAIRHRAVLLQIAMRKLELATVRVPTPTQREYMPEQVQYAVVDRKVTEGEMLKDAPGTSTATFELVMDGVLKLEVQVPERYADEVEQGQDVQIRVDAHPDQVFSGKVLRINPLVDRTSRTFGVQVYVPNPERELKAGGFAEVEILTYKDPQAWTVSVESVDKSVGSTRVFVWRDGTAHPILVETGGEGHDYETGRAWVELVRGSTKDLREDDIVIRGGDRGLQMLAEGTPVKIRKTAELDKVTEQPSATR